MNELLAGAPIDAKHAARILKLKEPAARAQLKALEAIAGVQKTRAPSGIWEWQFTAPIASWSVPTIIAACLGSSIAPLLEPSAYGKHLAGLRSKLLTLSKREARFPNIDRKFWFRGQGGDANIQDDETLLDDLLEALLEEQAVELDYINFAGAKRRASVQPLSLIVYGHQLYLLVRHPDGSLRPLRMSRIRGVKKGECFTYPSREEFHPESAFEGAFGVWIGKTKPQKIELLLRESWLTHADTHRWHSTQRVRLAKDGVHVELTCRVCPELEQWVLSFGEEAEVLRPAALRKRIARRVALLARRYV